MSATLGLLLKQLEPGLTVEIFETLDLAAAESSTPGIMQEPVIPHFAS